MPRATSGKTARLLVGERFDGSRFRVDDVVIEPARPPSAPQHLTATPDPRGGILLRWDLPADEGGSPVSSYLVHNGTAETQVWGRAFRDAVGPAETRAYTVRALSGDGAGPPSERACAISYPSVQTGLECALVDLR